MVSTRPPLLYRNPASFRHCQHFRDPDGFYEGLPPVFSRCLHFESARLREFSKPRTDFFRLLHGWRGLPSAAWVLPSHAQGDSAQLGNTDRFGSFWPLLLRRTGKPGVTDRLTPMQAGRLRLLRWVIQTNHQSLAIVTWL